MSNNTSIGTPTGGNALGFAAIGIGVILVIVGFFFMPWLTYSDFSASYTGWQIVGLDVDTFGDDPLEVDGDAEATVTYDWNRDGETLSGEIPVYDLFPPEGGSNLAFVLLMVILIIIFAGFAYVVQSRKYDYVSSISWVSIIGIYGILFLLFFGFVSQSNRQDEFRQRLTREVLANAGQAAAEEEVTDADAATDADAEDTEQTEAESGGRLTVATISRQVEYGDYSSATGALSPGYWVTMLGMIGLAAQIFIPRDLSNLSNVLESDGGHVSSGVVTSDGTVLVDSMVRQGIISIAVVFALLPVVFILSSAFNPTGQLSTQGLIPTNVDNTSELFTNFYALTIDPAVLEIFPFWNWIFNSFVVATTSTILVVLITAMSAYAFSRFRFAGRRTLLLGILLIQVFPNLLAMVALFLILQQVSQLPENIPNALPFLAFIDWTWLELFGLNSLGGLILVYMGGAMGINTWLMKGFFDSIPRDIDESALVDGATHWEIFWLLIFPLVRPILAVVGILAFVGTFNEFVLARVLLRDKEKWTLMVGLFNFVNADFNRDWGKFAAGALIATVPVVMIYIALQDQIVGGLTAGSVKG